VDENLDQKQNRIFLELCDNNCPKGTIVLNLYKEMEFFHVQPDISSYWHLGISVIQKTNCLRI